jgi:hypothetical protein
MLALISVTAVARFVKVWNEASGRDVAVRRRVVTWREGKVESRWRTWREGAGVPRDGVAHQRTGVPVGRWRARRQEALSSRSGRTLRARRHMSRQHSPSAGGTNGIGGSRNRENGGSSRSRPSRGPLS